jgi:hypothetical protein
MYSRFLSSCFEREPELIECHYGNPVRPCGIQSEDFVLGPALILFVLTHCIHQIWQAFDHCDIFDLSTLGSSLAPLKYTNGCNFVWGRIRLMGILIYHHSKRTPYIGILGWVRRRDWGSQRKCKIPTGGPACKRFTGWLRRRTGNEWR